MNVKSNEARCTSCHAGYGWEDDSFDFTAENKVDCLACHDTTGKYKKIPGLSGHPNYDVMEWPPHSGNFREPTDLTKIAQNVGKTSRDTCGACHFYGGGGNNVKHGDLEEALLDCSYEVDVHMSSDSLDMNCIDCHKKWNKENKSKAAPTSCSKCHPKKAK